MKLHVPGHGTTVAFDVNGQLLSDGATVLHLAVASGHPKMVKFFLELGPKPDLSIKRNDPGYKGKTLTAFEYTKSKYEEAEKNNSDDFGKWGEIYEMLIHHVGDFNSVKPMPRWRRGQYQEKITHEPDNAETPTSEKSKPIGQQGSISRETDHTQTPNQRRNKKKNKKSSCFPGHSLVDTPDGTIRMDEIEVGTLIHDGSSYSRVVGFLHRSIDIAPTQYLSINFDNDQQLEISPKHCIFLADGHDMFARDVQVGDVMASGQVVRSIDRTKYNSLFAPLTETGTVMVNGVLASCYADFPHSISHAVVFFPMQIYNLFATAYFARDSSIPNRVIPGAFISS